MAKFSPRLEARIAMFEDMVAQAEGLMRRAEHEILEALAEAPEGRIDEVAGAFTGAYDRHGLSGLVARVEGQLALWRAPR